MARITEETTNGDNLLMELDLDDKNLIKGISTRVIPVAAYPMNIKGMDTIIKQALRDRRFIGNQASDERL